MCIVNPCGVSPLQVLTYKLKPAVVEAKSLGRDKVLSLLLKLRQNTKPEDFTFTTKGAIYYVTIGKTLFSPAKVLYFRSKAHLIFHWCHIINQNPQFYTPKWGREHPHPFNSRVTPRSLATVP